MSWRTRTLAASMTIGGLGISLAIAQHPPKDPDARRTWVAERRARIEQMSPEERATHRAERHKHREDKRANRPARPIAIEGPLPLPVEVQTGRAAGGSCPSGERCTLELTPTAGEVVVITAVWSADEIACDDAKSSTPPGGEPIQPQWRCERSFVAKGTGAGFTAYIAPK